MGFFIELGIFIAIIIMASAFARNILGRSHKRVHVRHTQAGPVRSGADEIVELAKLKHEEHKEARETYERLVREKLDVMKTAVEMGYGEDQLAALDERLEKLIGTDKLKSLLDEEGEIPTIDADLLDTELEAEIERLRKTKAKE